MTYLTPPRGSARRPECPYLTPWRRRGGLDPLRYSKYNVQMSDDVLDLDATAQAELVRTGQVSPAELVDGAIARIERLNPHLNAVIHTRFEQARDETASGALPDGPFRGVPFLFKDIFCAVQGDPYHHGTRILKNAGFRAMHTDELARRYLAAGFAYLGRTNVPELGLMPTCEPEAYGPTLNPWDPARTCGGSSGGSSVAVATGMVPLAHANDGGGSTRVPAAVCGLVGLKPSRGRTSLGPMTDPVASPLPSELCVSRTVRDTAAVLQAVHGPGPGDSVMAPPPLRPFTEEIGADPGRLRVGLLVHDPMGLATVHPDNVAAAEETGRLLESLGHVVDYGFPPPLSDAGFPDRFTAMWTCTLPAGLDAFAMLLGRPVTADDVEPLTWELAQRGRSYSGPEAMASKAASMAYGREVSRWWSGYDLLLTPTLATPPVEHGAFVTPADPFEGFKRAAEFIPFTAAFNISGQPAISLPLHGDSEGRPLGIQLVAAYGREDVLLRVASQLEQACPWEHRRPPVA